MVKTAHPGRCGKKAAVLIAAFFIVMQHIPAPLMRGPVRDAIHMRVTICSSRAQAIQYLNPSLRFFRGM
ncbi:MAG: hypothetical protein KA369_09030 [Spirochaetes bacterium]|nr:hypothetical protein [Spirochaetota bacterium]